MFVFLDIVPEILSSSPKSLTIEEGKPLELVAEIENALAVIWLLNGEEVNDKFRTKQDGNTYTLTTRKMDESFAGEYTLEITSSTGHLLKQTFKIDFKGKEF